MLQLLLAAPSSGSGKTTAACALLSALKARGLEPCAFKCGPDYIDPMFHRAVLGVPSHNLDLFFSTPQTVRRLYTSGAAGALPPAPGTPPMCWTCRCCWWCAPRGPV